MKVKITDGRDTRTIEIEGEGEDAAKVFELAKEFLCPKPLDLRTSMPIGASYDMNWAKR